MKTAQLNPTADFLNAKQTLLDAMRHHAILGSLKNHKVTLALGYDVDGAKLTEDQITEFLETEERISEELNYWGSVMDVTKAREKFLKASEVATYEYTTPEQAKQIKTLFSKVHNHPGIKDKLVNLCLSWGGN